MILVLTRVLDWWQWKQAFPDAGNLQISDFACSLTIYVIANNRQNKGWSQLSFDLSLFNCIEMCFSFAPHVIIINSLKHGLSQNPNTHISPFLLLFWLKFPFYRYWRSHQKLKYSGCKMVFKLLKFVSYLFLYEASILLKCN